MRILAIRGRNLASLADDWEIDFEAEPLGTAGIFAITGPTGAGKSTLLDAMCLALFNTLPRLEAAERAQIGAEGGNEVIGAKDCRSILRHGAAEGFAEVDFVGRDRRRRRARWSVRRARGQAAGTLQKVEQSLCDLESGERLGGTRTQTLAAIQDAVGLTAAQFTRAVLLAQGEFDAFIRADSNERAVLLERLTGSQIYARLGSGAFAKARALEGEMDHLRTQIEAQDGLDDSRRAAAEESLAEAAVAYRSASARLSRAQAARAWEDRSKILADLVERCEQALVQARAANEEAEPRRERLRRSETAFALVAEWRAVGECRARAKLSDEAVSQFERDVEEADSSEKKARDEEMSAGQRLSEAEAEAEAMEPDLEEARRLDREIREAEAELSVRAGPLADGLREASRLADELGRAQSALSEAKTELDGQAQWLASHSSRADLAVREAELIEDLGRLAEAERHASSLEAKLIEARTEAADLVAQADEAAAAHAAEVKRLEEVKADLAAARAAAPSAGALDALRKDRDSLQSLESSLGAVEAEQARLDEGGSRVTELSNEQDRLLLALARCEARRAEIGAALPAVRARLDEAGRARDLSSAAAEVAAADMRDKLVAGEPCPVCGALEHRIDAVDRLISERLAEDRQRFQDLDGEVRELEQEDAILSDRLTENNRRRAAVAEALQGAAAEAEAQREKHAAQVRALRGAAAAAAIQVDPAAAPPALRREIEARIAAADAEWTRLSKLQGELESARVREEESRNSCEAAGEASMARRGSAEAAEQRRALLAHSVREAREAHERLDRAVDSRLSPYFDWRDAADPAAELAEMVGEWRERRLAHDALQGSLVNLGEAVHRAQIASEAASAAQAVLEKEAARWKERCVQTRGDRLRLLEGEATETVARRLDDALQRAREAVENARQAREARARAAVSARSLLGQARERRQADHEESTRRGDEFQARLTALSIGEPLVEEAAAAGRAAMDSEKAELDAVAQSVRNAETALATRREDLDSHASGERPALAGEALLAELAEAQAAEEEARLAQDQAAYVIRRDDSARERTAALRAELEIVRAGAEVWLRLDALIGSRNGDRFRRFAQGLTLDRLIGHANVRLAELKPRYALERGRGGDMLIQVIDHELGGEVRGLHNLSGGERFLVSLALALGLSEMSTGRGLLIESLFIDEGFGALDGQSLGAAIALLEQLHATGRRVGVISHVEEVKERIPVKIEVTPIARGRSELAVVGL